MHTPFVRLASTLAVSLAAALLVGCGGTGSGTQAPTPDTGPKLPTGVTKEEMKDQTRRFPMRARGGVQPLLTDEQVKAVAAYVWSISHKS